MVGSLKGCWVPASKGVRRGRKAVSSQASLSGRCRAVGTRDGEVGHSQTLASLSPLAVLPAPLPLILSLPRCISTLYKDPAWSQVSLQGPIERAQARVCSSKMGAMSTERLQYYVQELGSLESSGRSVSLIDLWGLLIEYFLYQEVREEQIINKSGSFPLLPHQHLLLP